MFFGILLIVIGLIFLLQNLGIITGDVWGILWPCVIIAIGASIAMKDRKKGKKMCGFEKMGEDIRRKFSGEE